MRVRLLMALAVLSIAAMSGISATAHQTTGTDPGDTAVKCGKNVTVVSQAGETLYLDVRDVAGFAPEPVGHDGQYIWSIWVYAESNGHAGMQTVSGTKSEIDEEDIENCTTGGHTGASAASDTLLY